MGRINFRLLSTPEKVSESSGEGGPVQRLCVEESQKWQVIIITLLCSVVAWRLPGRHMVSAGKLRLKALLVGVSLLKRDLSCSVDSMAAVRGGGVGGFGEGRELYLTH